MKAVVMAGGQGSRLRPLTSNIPKPMVTIGNKPCAQHILELLQRHGINEVVMTVAFLSEVIRNHFGDGSALGMKVEYSVEETPLGTAGSVKNAESVLDDTFIVISGDALTDFDLTRIIGFHQQRGAMVTIALKSVDNPLEFGVVIVDEEGRIERFLEKPGWGQVFSDTINTGIYVLEPEVLDYIPSGTAYDFSHELFPRLFEMRKPLYGSLQEGYWQDIGNLEQYLQANRDALDGRVKLQLPGVRLRGNVWVGEGVGLDNLERVEGPAVIGNYARIEAQASIGPHMVLGNNVVLRSGSHVAGSVIGDNSYVASGARVTGAVVGGSVDIRANAVVSEGAVVGDQCSVGENAFVGNGVKVYPFKTIEAGSSVKTSLIWETRGASALFGKSGVRGLVNVDITPEKAMRLAMSYGTLMSKGAFVTASRDSHAASRVLKRAIITGLNSAGISVRDLEVVPVCVNRFDLKGGKADAGIHVRLFQDDAEQVEILFSEPPGIPIQAKRERNIENYYHREDFRRALMDEVGTIEFPSRLVESYQSACLAGWDSEAIRRSGLRVVVDYSGSAAAGILPRLMDQLELAVLSASGARDIPQQRSYQSTLPLEVEKTARLIQAMEADMGILLDPGAEHLVVLDEFGRRVSDHKLLMLLAAQACQDEGSGVVALPLTVSDRVEELVLSHGATVRRTKVSPAELMAQAAQPGTIFAGSASGGFIFPSFSSGMDAIYAYGKVLELAARKDRPLSRLVDELPDVYLTHNTVPCPWHLKGAVMRLMVEELKEKEVSLIDGIKVTTRPGQWVQLLPDADEPVFHIYAESTDAVAADTEAASFGRRLEALIAERRGE
ncbi:MAG: NTP transferase domain-containing protein [Gaiellales bacterium]|nr:NTP transferase domain-containing protein [Gaiellales bacterium]